MFCNVCWYTNTNTATIPGEFWQVVSGYDQGLPHTSHCADLGFHNHVESLVLGSLRRHGILKYIRYRDDILIVALNNRRMDGVVPFIQRMRRLGRWWSIKAEEVGPRIKFLNFMVSEVNGRVCTSPVI